ncbi:MAG: sigma-70 family RNA polymerase sigma factor [Acidobacteria bacterium]|nr:sigma-70 family RNA polymerase sigma factor [Acidobacteriota bacterium]MBI3426178.1 sigma-70 family RNA polymerase sigma factor [Acidobacteriota bacterium]
MTPASTHDVTQLLLAWRNGAAGALEQLTPLVYDELRRLAARYVGRERADHTLQATALVNEAYLQLINQQQVAQVDWQSRAHFIGIAARLMRQILVDHARAHAAAKRGAGAAALPLAEAIAVPAPNVIALDDALRDLAKLDERKSRIIELRYFGGLSMDEIAEVTGLSVATLRRDMRMAEAWLGRQIQRR